MAIDNPIEIKKIQKIANTLKNKKFRKICEKGAKNIGTDISAIGVSKKL